MQKQQDKIVPLVFILFSLFLMGSILASGDLLAFMGSSSEPWTVTSTTHISISEQGFEPAEAIITPGDQVVWTNQSAQTVTIHGGEKHEMYLPLIMTDPDGAGGAAAEIAAEAAALTAGWDSGPLAPGESYTLTFSVIGAIPYHLAEQWEVRGWIYVQNPSTPTPTATSTPTPTPTATSTPTPTNTPMPDAAVLVGAGDIAGCDYTGDEATANLLDNIQGTVITLGDNVYPDGTDAEFNDCYHPNWGRHKARTRPAAGNHDYVTENASGYFNYFGAAAGAPDEGYYSYDVGDWHIIVLNSQCSPAGGCDLTDPQGQWLQADLAANPSTCTLAYWHHPRFSSGGNYTKVQDFWSLLYEAGADIVLNGHRHIYERFGLQDPNGVADPERGIRQFVVGTGGAGLSSLPSEDAPNSEVKSSESYGVLRLTLQPTSYEWEFIPIAGETFTDAGSGLCVVP